ncbi:MAG: thiamine-binding protein [Chitinivibrionales bacterium]
MEISVEPVSTGGPLVGGFVARVLDTLKGESSITYELTPMGTVVQADSLDRLFEIAKGMHERLFGWEIKRLVIIINEA